MNTRVITFIFAVANTFAAVAAEPAELRKLKKELEASVLKLDVEFEGAKAKLDEFYLEHLKSLQAQHQKDGDLAAALRVRDGDRSILKGQETSGFGI